MPCLSYLSADRAMTLTCGLQTGAPGVTMTTGPEEVGEGWGTPLGLWRSCSLSLSPQQAEATRTRHARRMNLSFS